MKIGFLIFLLFLAPLAWAGETDNNPAAGSWYVGAGGTVDIPASNWYAPLQTTVGPSEIVGCRLGGPLALQADLDQLFYSGGGYNLANYRGLLLLKYTYVNHGLEHYLLAGPGFVYQTLGPTNQSTLNLDLTLGMGFQLELSHGLDAYVEGKFNGILSNSLSFGDVPLSGGVLLDL